MCEAKDQPVLLLYPRHSGLAQHNYVRSYFLEDSEDRHFSLERPRGQPQRGLQDE